MRNIAEDSARVLVVDEALASEPVDLIRVHADRPIRKFLVVHRDLRGLRREISDLLLQPPAMESVAKNAAMPKP